MEPMEAQAEEVGLGRKQYTGNKDRGQKRQARPGWPTTKTTNLQPASTRSLRVATRWIEIALDYGYEMPFNAEWMSHPLAAKVVKDPRMQPLLEKKPGKVMTLLDKMTDLFWRDYLRDEDAARNLLDIYLYEVWEDLRDYAITCLTAARLKETGRTVSPPEYEARKDQELHKALFDVKFRAYMEKVEQAKKQEKPRPERPNLAERRRAMLRSRSHEENGDSE